MKKLAVAVAAFVLLASASQAQTFIRGVKNQAELVKGSRALPSVKYKDGLTISMANTEDEGMTFTTTKNGKQYPLFDPVDATFGQLAETDIEGDGKMEILAGYRTAANSYTINIYKKAEFETEHKLWSTINGQHYAEFPGDGTVKMYTKEGSISVMKFDEEGKLTEAAGSK